MARSAKARSIKFAVGKPGDLFSTVWHVAVTKDDVYVGTAHVMAIMKLSLHGSGVWAWAATEESGAKFENGNRRAKRWLRPSEHAPGITRGPSILVPWTSFGSHRRGPDSNVSGVFWVPKPETGEMVEFSFYFVALGVETRWNATETVVAERKLTSGGRLVVLVECKQAPNHFLAAVERVLQQTPFPLDDPSASGTFFWISESPDSLRIPILTDLPPPFTKIRLPPSVVP